MACLFIKKNDVHDVANYRPISILSIFSKVFERIVYNRMMNYIDKYNIVDTAQHGFRSGRSTHMAAFFFVEIVHDCLHKDLFVTGLFFDLSRAFDSLSYEFFIDKCYNIGFRGIFLTWIQSYLESRTIRVKVDSSFSREENTNLGLPQGSVLGSLLFLLFINDLPGNLKNILFLSSGYTDFNILMNSCKLVLFTDDTSVVISTKTFEELQNLCTVTLVTVLCRLVSSK